MNTKLIALFFVLYASQNLQANPTGFTAVAGDVQPPYTDNSGAMVVESGKRAIVEWESFSVQQQEVMRFMQMDPSSSILNRVTGKELSEILGKIESNGRVFLINPSGIIVGQEGLVQTAGFYASTADILNAEFLKGLPLELSKFGDGEIINFGTIRTSSGDIGLFARAVKNEGTLSAPEGSVLLGSAPQILLQPEGNQRMFIRIETDEDFSPAIENNGKIEALTTEIQTGGSIYSKAIRQTGTIEASALRQEGGRVFLTAAQGSIEIEGTISLPEGELLAQAVDILVSNTANIDISSPYGKGGKAEFVGTNTAFFEGNVVGTGDLSGGFVEVSAPVLHYKGNVDLRSPSGQTGTLLLDPKNIAIVTGGPDSATVPQAFGYLPAANQFIDPATLTAALNTAAVVLQANTDIEFQNSVAAAATPGNSLTLQAGRSIIFDAGVVLNLNNAALLATVNDPGALSNRDPGDAQFSMATGSQILTGGGDITITGGSLGVSPPALLGELSFVGPGTVINAAGGSITLTGVGYTGSSVTGITITGGTLIETVGAGDITLTGTGSGSGTADNYGIFIGGASQLTTTAAGAIALTGTGSTGTDGCDGIHIQDVSTLINSVNGPITLTGTGQGSGINNTGVFVSDATISSSGTGVITLGGNTTAGTDESNGILLINAATISAVNGAISISGSSTGSGIECNGVSTDTGPVNISSSGTAPITLSGFGSDTGINTPDGIHQRFTTITSSGTGSVHLTGTGGATGSNSAGVAITDTSVISSTGSGTITIDGTGGAGAGGGCIGSSLVNSEIGSSVGAVMINGHTNGGGGQNLGVVLTNGIIDTTIGLGSASVTLNGTGSSNGTTFENVGVVIIDDGVTFSSITTQSGPIFITGLGNGIGSDSPGVAITANVAGVGSTIQSTSGPITIIGTGANGSGDSNSGIQIDDAATLIHSDTGQIALTGLGNGANDNNEGIGMSGGTISSISGFIILEGTSSVAGANANNGISIQNASTTVLTSQNGSISLTGHGNGTAANNDGIIINGNTTGGGVTISSTGSAPISLTGFAAPNGTDFNNGMHLLDTQVTSSGSGTITLTGTGGGTGMGPQGVTVDTNTTIASTGSGPIVIIGTGGSGTADASGVSVGSPATISSTSAPIEITGQGGSGVGGANFGVFNTGTITGTGPANIIIHGTAPFPIGVNEIGVLNVDSTISVEDGTLSIVGIGGGSLAQNPGVVFAVTASASATGTGNISITGTGGSGTDQNYGVAFIGDGGAGTVTVANGSLNVLGEGGQGTGDGNIGINVSLGYVLSGAGASPVHFTGFAGTGSSNTDGIVISDPSTIVQTDSGSLDFVGRGRSLTDDGIQITTNAIVRTTSGPLSLESQSSNISVLDSASVTTTTGSLTALSGNNMNVQSSDITITAGSEPLLLKAQVNIDVQNTSGPPARIRNLGTGPLTLVTDNQFPAFPLFGPGGFTIDATSFLSTGSGELRIYTAEPSENSIDPAALLNGITFTPGPFGVDSNREKWSIYYPGGSYGDPVFTIYYKVPIILPPPRPYNLNAVLANMELFFLIDNLITYPRYLPYHGKFCIPAERWCKPTYDRHGTFIFEDDLFWVDGKAF